MKVANKAIVLLLILSALLVSQVYAADWLSNYDYKIGLDITGSSVADQTDYTVKVNIFYQNITRFFDFGDRKTTIVGNPTDRHTFHPVHSTRIQAVNKFVSGETRKYLGYDTNKDGTEIRLYYSDSIGGQWTGYTGNPIISGVGCRWPSVAYIDGTFHMIVSNTSLGRIDRWTSTDGISYTFNETILDETDAETRNPYVWLNPNDNKWYLYWKDNGAGNIRYIKVRSATSIQDLDGGTDTTVLTRDGTLGAPSVMYWASQYWLVTESKEGTIWTVEAWHSTSPTSGFIECGNSDILRNDEACPIILLNEDSSRAFLFSNRNSTSDNWYQDTRELAIHSSISLDEECRTDFGDIRFTLSDNATQLDYWIQEQVASDYAIFWIQVPTIQASPETMRVWMYYGKSATSQSNAANTLLFYDDFSTTIDWVTKWQSTNQSCYSIVGLELQMIRPTLNNQTIQTLANYTGFAVEVSMRVSVTNTQGYLLLEPNVTSYLDNNSMCINWLLDELVLHINDTKYK